VELGGVAVSDAPLSDSMRSKSRELAASCLQELHNFDMTVLQTTGPVMYWLAGKLCTRPAPRAAQRAPAAHAEHQAFAESVKPSKELVRRWQESHHCSDVAVWHMLMSSHEQPHNSPERVHRSLCLQVNSVGLWDRPTVVLQKLAMLLTYVPPPHLPTSSSDLDLYLEKLHAQRHALKLLLSGSTVPSGSDDSAGEPCCPAGRHFSQHNGTEP
jgi:hypothetical protein